MPDDPNPDPAPDPEPDDKPDPDAAAKKALDEERKARRTAEKAAADLRAKLKDLEDRDKTDGEKLTERITQAEKRAEEAEARALRLEIATSKGLTTAQAKRLVGSTAEELEADADELLTTFAPASDGGAPPSAKPTEHLRGGGDPTEDPPVDMRKVVDAIPRGF